MDGFHAGGRVYWCLVFSITCFCLFLHFDCLSFSVPLQLPMCSCQSRAMWSWQILGWRDSWQIPRLRGTHLLARLSGWLRRLSNSQHMISRWVCGLDKRHSALLLWVDAVFRFAWVFFLAVAWKDVSLWYFKSSPWSDNVVLLLEAPIRRHCMKCNFGFQCLDVKWTHLT